MFTQSSKTFLHRARSCATPVTIGLVVLGAFTGMSSSAVAAEPGASQRVHEVSDATSVVSAPVTGGTPHAGHPASPTSTVISYWTVERMRRAVPVEEPTLTAGPPAATPAADRARAKPAGSTSPSAPAPGTTTPARALAGSELAVSAAVNASATVGRVFFHDPSDGRDHSCSGSALNSNSKRLVITAGHCVHGGSGRAYMQNWVFVPLYDHGARPFGTFSARTFRTFNAWTGSSSRDHDIAMVTTWNNERNQVLINTVGGNGLSWNYSRSIFLTILAYPADPPYDGTWQQYCQGTTRRVSLFDGRIELRCGFTGGSSGGPWLRAYNNATGLGNVNGIMSTLTTTGWNRSSYFDDKVKSMLDATAND
jgi:V8-like Glu-specific endopeptidase